MSGTINPRCAYELVPGDVILWDGYPADLLEVNRLPSGVVHLVYGCDDSAQVWVSPDTVVDFTGRVE
jgi:hypothetical protein